PRALRQGLPPVGPGTSGVSEQAPDRELLRHRRQKLEALRERGVDPFGTRYPVTHWAGPLAARLGGAVEDELKGFSPVCISGRIVSMRHHGKTCFAHLQDYTARIQLSAPAAQLGDHCAHCLAVDL